MTTRKFDTLISDVKAAGWEVATTVGTMTAKSPDGVQEVGIRYEEGVFVEAWVNFPDQDRRVKLKNASAVRMQVTFPQSSKPVRVYASKEGGSERPVDEMPMDARDILPFSLDADQITIIASIAGKRVVWRNMEMNRIEAARMPADRSLIRIVVHPRYRRRMILWSGELGPCTVLLDRIRRVLP